jgi:hypothetical protein
MRCSSTFTCRRELWLALLALAMIAPCSRLKAQTAVGVISDQRMPDSAQQAAAMAMSMRMRSPAVMALSMKQELGLSAEQVAAIEALVPIEADSARLRMGRLMTALSKGPMKDQSRSMLWTGPIDEAAIRAAACEQSRSSADMLIGLMRDRHALGVLLTPDQQRQFDALQGEMMSRVMRSKPNR